MDEGRMRSVYDLLSVSPSLQQTYPRELLNPTMAKGQEAPCLCTDTKSNQEGGLYYSHPSDSSSFRIVWYWFRGALLCFHCILHVCLKNWTDFTLFSHFLKINFIRFGSISRISAAVIWVGQKGLFAWRGVLRRCSPQLPECRSFPRAAAREDFWHSKGITDKDFPWGTYSLPP